MTQRSLTPTPPSLRLLSLVALVLFASCTATEQTRTPTWRSDAFRAVGYVSHIVPDPSDSNTVYSVVRGGFYRSEDGGDTWKNIPRNSNGGTGRISTLAVTHAGVLLASLLVREGGLRTQRDQNSATLSTVRITRSTDSGETWQVLDFGTLLPPSAPVQGFRWIGGERLVVWTPTALIVSDDAGATWSPLPAPIPFGARLDAVASHPSGVLAAKYYDLESREYASIVLSLDGGTTWSTTPISRPLPQDEFWISTLSVDAEGTLFGTRWNEPYIWRSVDSGATWTSTALDAHAIFSVQTPLYTREANKPNSLYLTTNNGGVFVSNDGGITWEHAGLDDLTVEAYARVVSENNGKEYLLAGASNGIHRRLLRSDEYTP